MGKVKLLSAYQELVDSLLSRQLSLQGSEKQIKWATEIRTKWLEHLVSELVYVKAKNLLVSDTDPYKKTKLSGLNSVDYIQLAARSIGGTRHAKTFIENRRGGSFALISESDLAKFYRKKA